MAQFGKATGSKRGKPTYIYSIIGVALVLFLFGLMGWLFLGIRKSGDNMKEKLGIKAFIASGAKKEQIDSLKNYVMSLPFAKDVTYISKEKAKEIYNRDFQDTSWKKFLGEDYPIPFPASVEFNVKASYVNPDSLRNLENDLRLNYGDFISSIDIPTDTVKSITSVANWILLILIALIVILGIIVIISIDNTIRLAMYSNRFLMKTMQMVGATRRFILQPILIRALINGLIASAIAILLVLGFVWVMEFFLADFRMFWDTRNSFLLFALMIVLGVAICVFSTYRSVLKYLKMKLDDLY